jgi:hypothetical protein
MKNSSNNQLQPLTKTIHNPKNAFETNKNINIVRILINDEETRIDFVYQKNLKETLKQSFQISPDCYIKISTEDTKYKLLRADNIALAPYKNIHYAKHVLFAFSLFFPAVPKNAQRIDVIESEAKDKKYFNFYGVNLYSQKFPARYFKS